MHWVLRSLQIWIPESACLLGGRHLVRKSELYGRASKFVHTYSRGFPKSSVRRHALLRKPGSVRILVVYPPRIRFLWFICSSYEHAGSFSIAKIRPSVPSRFSSTFQQQVLRTTVQNWTIAHLHGREAFYVPRGQTLECSVVLLVSLLKSSPW